MRTGQLKHRVWIQASTEVTDADGGISYTWPSSGGTRKVFAEIRPTRGDEFTHGDAAVGTRTHTVTIREYPGLSSHTHRLLFGSRVLNILQIRHLDERGAYMVLICEERTDTI